MNQDFVDLLRVFAAHDVRFLIAIQTSRSPFARGRPWRASAYAPTLLRNKRATGRAKDLGDIEGME